VEKNGEGSGSGRRDRTTPELEQIFRQGKAMSHLSNSERMHVFSEKVNFLLSSCGWAMCAVWRKDDEAVRRRAEDPEASVHLMPRGA
jgi:hypothetical protein